MLLPSKLPEDLPLSNLNYHSCEWKYIRPGFMDWWAEYSLSTGNQRAANKRVPVFAMAGVALAMMMGLAVTVGLMGSGIAKGMALVGSRTIANLSMIFTAVIAVTVTVWLPAWAGWNVHRFSHALSRRGWELANGHRAPFRP